MKWFKRRPLVVNVTINGPTTDAETGRKIVEAIRAYENRNGKGWAA